MAHQPYIDLEPFMAEAQKIAGCDDWGDDEFREPLRVFVDSLNSEAKLTPLGLERTRNYVRRLLVGRLTLHRDRKLHPEIAREEIRAPLMLTGLGRSGTSYLYGLLGADPRNLAPTHWQIWNPSPPPAYPSTDTSSQRAAGAHDISFEGWDDPDIRNKHDYSSEGLAEDTLIHHYAFTSPSFGVWWNVPSYVAWLKDIGPAYRFERKMLQALQYGSDRRQWVTKSPLHVPQLPWLVAEFPDARLVMNIRDPAKTLASILSLMLAHRRQFGDDMHATLGREYALGVIDASARRVETMMAFRDDPANDRKFIDVPYLDLERDPLGQVARVYDYHGIEFTEAARASMQAYVAENRKGKHGLHRYDIRDLGVRVEEIRERFEAYMNRFDIQPEN